MAGEIQRRVRIVYEVDGVEQAAEEQLDLASALDRTGEALAEQERAASSAEDAMSSLSDIASRSEQIQQRLHQSMQALAGGLQQVSAALGTESEGGRVVGQMSRFAATGIQLGSAFGPLGGVLGGVTGAVLGLGEALTPTVPAIRDVTEEARRSADAALDMGAAFDGAGERMRAFVNEVSTAGRARGLTDLNAQITELADRIAFLSGGRGSSMERLELPGLRERMAALSAEAEGIGQAIQGELSETGANRRRGGGSRRRPTEDPIFALARGRGQDDAIGFALGLGDDGRPTDFELERADQARQSRNRGFAPGMADRAQLEGIRRVAEAQRRAHEEQMARIEEQVSAWTSAGERIGGVIASAFTTAIQGQEDFGVAVIKGFKSIAIEFGGQMIAEGVGALFTAIGSAVLNPPAAATKAAEGAGKIALGVSLGAAGAAIPVQSRGGQSKAPRLGPQGSAEGGGGSVVVNMNAPAVITGTRAETGRELERALRASRNRFGRAA